MSTETPVRKIKGMEVVVYPHERDAILSRVGTLLDRGYLMWGDEQAEFSGRWSTLTGKPHAVTFNSATAALETLFTWLAAQGKRRVAFPANHFPSPAMAAIRAGLEVTWVDIAMPDMAPSVAQLDARFGGSPVASIDVLCLQWAGGFISSEVLAIAEWCRTHAVVFVEDASHAAGSRAFGRSAGSFGDYAVFSLASTKALHTGQGGVLLTDDQDLATFAFRAKNYGRTEMFQKGQYVQAGWNSHLTEMQAAMGNVLFASLEERTAERRQLAGILTKYCEQVGVRPLGAWNDDFAPNLYKMPVWIRAASDVPQLRAFMADRGIELGSSIYDFVTAALPLFHGGEAWDADSEWPGTAEYACHHVCLPMHNKLTQEDAHRVGEALLAFYGR